MEISTFRDNNFTEKQLKGIDLAVKSISKKYNFIIGWRLDDDYENYKTQIYITLFVDWDKVADFYGVKMKSFWVGFALKSSIALILSPFEKDNKDIDFNENYEETNKIKEKLSQLYSFLPDDFKIFYDLESPGISSFKQQCALNCSGFLKKD